MKWQACLSVISFLVTLLIPTTLSCGNYIYKPSMQERMEAAEYVLYGKDVTEEYACSGDSGACGRRKIEFQVYCALKGSNIPSQITIGENNDVGDCDVNVISYSSRSEMLVLVKEVSKGVYGWDSMPGQRAHFLVSADVAGEDAGQTCSVRDFTSLSGSGCPRLPEFRQGCDSFRVCTPPYFMSGDSCYRVTKQAGLTREAAVKSCGPGWLASFPDEAAWKGVAEVLGEEEQGWWIGVRYQGEGSNRHLVYTNAMEQTKDVLFSALEPGNVGTGNFFSVSKSGWKIVTDMTEVKGAICQQDPAPPMLMVPDIDNRLLQIEYETEPISIYVCCNGASYGTSKITLNSASKGIQVEPGNLRTEPKVVLSDSGQQEGSYYTLVMVDTTPSKGKANPTRPYINWLLMDLSVSSTGGIDTAAARTFFSYESPTPSSDIPHTYVAYLYRQTAMMYQVDAEQELRKYSDQNCLRCEFDLKLFVEELDLELADATSFKAKMDGWVARKLIMTAGASPASTCSKVYNNLDIRGEAVVCDWDHLIKSNSISTQPFVLYVMIWSLSIIYYVH